MEFSRQKYWSGLPFSFPGNLPNPGIKPGSPALEADSLPSDYTTIKTCRINHLLAEEDAHFTFNIVSDKPGGEYIVGIV